MPVQNMLTVGGGKSMAPFLGFISTRRTMKVQKVISEKASRYSSHTTRMMQTMMMRLHLSVTSALRGTEK